MISAEHDQNRDWPWLKSYPDNIDWHAPIKDGPVHEILEETVRLYGNRPAFDFMGRRWCWADIGVLVNHMARGLQDRGVGAGMRVGLFLPNTPYFVIAYYAILRTGATVVNYNPLYSTRELRHQIEDSGTDIMITMDLKILYDKMRPLLDDTGLKSLIICPFTEILPPSKSVLFRLLKRKDLAHVEHDDRHIAWDDLIDNDGAPDALAINPADDIAVLQYTGGTTGVPKGAMLTHANIVANLEQSRLWFPDVREGDEKMLGVIPFFHVFAMTAVMNLSVRMGFEIIALPRFELDKTMKLIDSHKPTIFPAVPAIFNAINNYKKRDHYDLKSLRFCVSGGAPLPVEVKKCFEKNTGCVVVEGYGLTESTPVACVNPVAGLNKAGSIGLPLPGTILEILDPETREPVAPGERGELCITGPQVMKGYWNKPEETAKTLIDGRLHTGDIAVVDEDGYFFIVDRIKDLIITNGYNVYPRNVEEAIYQHEAVEECIVAGLPDPDRGEIVKAWIKLKDGLSLDEEGLRSFLKDLLSPMEMPRRIEFREQPLPKTMIGKLSRKDIVAEELGEDR